MRDKINEVYNYFKSKILSGDFLISGVGQYTLYLLIDNKYRFEIWIGNPNIPEATRCYEGSLSFMHISFTDEEAIQLREILQPNIVKHKKEVLLKQKEEELLKLKQELNII